ncbi:MAG: AsmA-like C-terminal region-containing protein [Roseibium sp.]
MHLGSQSRNRRILNSLRFVVLGILVSIILAVATFVIVASLELFLPLRQKLASQLLTTVIGETVDVRGNVSLKLGAHMGVRIENAYVDSKLSKPDKMGRAFDLVQFDARYALLLGNASSISNFQMAGAEIEIAPNKQKADPRAAPLFEIPSLALNNPVFANFQMSDIVVRYLDSRDGWDETLKINSLDLTTAENKQEIYVRFDAILNGTPLSITGMVEKLHQSEAQNQSRFDLKLGLPGLDSHTTGVIDTSTEVAGVDGKISSKTDSIAQLLQSLGLVSARDGKATLNYTFSGPLNQLDLAGLEAKIESDLRNEIRLSGSVLDSTVNPVVDLEFDVNLALPPRENQKSLALELNGFSGKVTGPLGGLAIKEAQIFTNAAILDFDRIGPISVGRIVKQANNTVGLENIVIQDGPIEEPYFILTGQVEDIIGLAGVDLAGNYSFPVAPLFSGNLDTKIDLGIVEGILRLNDAAGDLGLEEFTGKSRKTDLYDLQFDIAVPGLRVVDELTFSTEFTMLEPSAFLRAFNIEATRSLPKLGFNGSSQLRQNSASFKGALTSGETQIEADVYFGPQDTGAEWLLDGSIASDRMNFADLSGLVQFSQLRFADPSEHIKVTRGFSSQFGANVDLSVKELVSENIKAGNLSAKVLYDEKYLKLSTLSVNYLGGTVRGDFGLDYSKTPKLASANGRIEKFPLKRLLKEFGIPSPVSSTVYSSFDVSGDASSKLALIKSLSGSVTTSLWGGDLPNRLLDLSGLNVFTWLVTSGNGNKAKLVCAVLPLHFKNGTASSRSLVIETENVQLVGAGSVNFRSGALNVAFTPRAKRRQLVEIVSPFELKGTLSAPDVVVKNAGAGRAVGEVVSLPLNLLGHIFGGSGQIKDKAKPCVLPKPSGPK